jgi:hypothetical protein
MRQRAASNLPRGAIVAALAWLTLAAVAVACGTSNAAGPAQGVVEGAQAIPSPSVVAVPPPQMPAYPPGSWMAKLQPPIEGSAIAIGCLDRNADGRLDGADGAEFQGLDIPLRRAEGCTPLGRRREWFVADGELPMACTAGGPAPLLVIAIAGGGTQLLDRDQGVSVGLIDIVNGVRTRAAAGGVPSGVILMTSAIQWADSPQRRMEEWLVADLRRRLDATSCLRVVLMGHSHGAVVVTSVMAALEGRYGDRMYGVLLDRSLLYYDRPVFDVPVRAALLNVFQLNEGWHGEPIASPNVINLDASAEVAPRDPREGPLPIVPVAHSTLDDSTGVQVQVVDEVAKWLRDGVAELAP